MKEKRATEAHHSSAGFSEDTRAKVKPKGQSTDNDQVSMSQLLDCEDLQSRMELIDTEIRRCVISDQGEPAQLYETANHLLLAGGKRLRSLLVLLTCEAVGGTAEKAIPFAIATEMIQTASLIHDDIIDEDYLRRGVETVHKKYGLRFAILAGDLLIAKAIQLAGRYANPKILLHLGEGGVRMVEGEAWDVMVSIDNPESVDTGRYLEMINRKTASFMKEAARMGAIIGEGSEAQIDSLVRYGELIGIAFQIRDDVLDVIGTQDMTGKSLLTDVKLKRLNYTVIYAIESCSEEKRQECFKKIAEGDIDYILELIKETDAVLHSVRFAEEHIEKAKQALEGYNFMRKDLLVKLADFIIARIH